jgi:hypothetical protein
MEGFLKPRRFSYINLDIIPLNGEKNRMALKKGVDPENFRETRLRNNEPLHNRAWAVQERYLSSRILHFMNTEMRWRCLEISRSESSVEGYYDVDYRIQDLIPTAYNG